MSDIEDLRKAGYMTYREFIFLREINTVILAKEMGVSKMTISTRCRDKRWLTNGKRTIKVIH